MASYNPTITVNLTKLFNSSFENKSNSFKRELRSIISTRDFVRDFKTRMIRTMRDNTRQKSLDKNGEPLKAYKDNGDGKSYKDSEVFKVLKGSTKVNLTLSGEMLESIEGIKKGDEIVFQMKGSRNKNIAHGHINGSNNLPVRDFLGIPEKEQKEIMRELIKFYSERNQVFEQVNIKPETTQNTQSFAEPTSLTDELFGVVQAGLFE